MKRTLISILAAVTVLGIAGALALAGRSSESTDTTMAGGMDNMKAEASSSDAAVDLTGQSEVAIDIVDYAYSQPNIKISKGTKVTWTNQDTVRHNATGANGAPNGGPKGPLLAKGESYSFTFNTIDVFNYICTPHPYMKGTVTVVQ